ncbi:hypothetical protein PG988_013597 [Apiospora saccharicola]
MKMQFAFVAALVAVVAAAPATTRESLPHQQTTLAVSVILTWTPPLAANPMAVEARQCVPEGGHCDAHSQCCSYNCRFGGYPDESTCRPPLGSPNDKI